MVKTVSAGHGSKLTVASLSPNMRTSVTWSSWDCPWPGEGVHLPVAVTAMPVESLMERLVSAWTSSSRGSD